MVAYGNPQLGGMTIDRLTAEFGEPHRIGDDCRWVLKRGNLPRAPIHLACNCRDFTPSMTVWIFDPAQPSAFSVVEFRVGTTQDLEDLVQRIRAQLKDR